MKKIYISVITITLAVSSMFAQTVPTCSLNTIFVASNKIGIFPDSIVNFVSGTVGVPYVQNITVKVPKDTVSSGFRFCFNKFVLYTPVGVTNYNFPPGLNIGSSSTITASPAVNDTTSLRFPGNANNCCSVYGTPTVAGSYTLQLEVQPYMNGPSLTQCPASPNINAGSPTIAPASVIRYYIINIAPAIATGIIDLGKDKMTLYQNVPNPFSATTDIKFYVEGEDNATVTVYNTLGSVVFQKSVKTTLGENTVTIDAANFANGTYIYSLKYKSFTTTKRMMVINN